MKETNLLTIECALFEKTFTMELHRNTVTHKTSEIAMMLVNIAVFLCIPPQH